MFKATNFFLSHTNLYHLNPPFTLGLSTKRDIKQKEY